MQVIARMFQRFALFGLIGAILLVGHPATAAGPADTTPRPLQDIAGWKIPELGAGIVTDLFQANNNFSGKLRFDALPPEFSPDVIGFRADGQRFFNVALIYPDRSLVSLVPPLKDTAVAEIDLPRLIVLLSPPENAGATLPLPTKVGTVAMPFDGGMPVKLEAGLKVFGRGALHGATAALLQRLGAPVRDVAVAGTLDPRMLVAAGLKNPALHADLINAIDLKVSLRTLALERKPAYLGFGDSALVIKGVAGRIASGVATSLSANVAGGTLRFDKVTINRDPARRTLSIVSGSTPGSSVVTLPVAGAAITEMNFRGNLDEQVPANDNFAILGKYAVAGSSPRNFTATLSGGSSAQYAVTLETDTSLGQLMGWSVPALDALVLRNVAMGNGYILGDLALRGQKFTVVLFRQGPQVKYSVAFLVDGVLRLPALMTKLQTTPFQDLELLRPGFLLVPPENAGNVILPEQVASHLPLKSLALKPGLNLVSQANLHGEAEALLRAVGLSTSGMLVTGSLDPSVLNAGDAPLSEAFINASALSVALPPVQPAAKPDYLSFGESTFVIKGVSGKFATGLATSMKVSVGAGLAFNTVTLNRDPVKREISISGNGGAPAASFIKFPVEGATITQVNFSGLINETNRASSQYVLDGKYSVANSTPRGFKATLSGGSPAQYAVTIETDTTLGQLMGWSAPGFDLLRLNDVAFGNGYIVGDLTLKGMKYSVALFKGTNQAKYHAAFLSDETFALPRLMSRLQVTPLADLQLAQPGFVLTPPENAGIAVRFPEPVAQHLKLAAADLKAGLNLISHADATGGVATLLQNVDLSPTKMLLTGNLDPSILAGAEGSLTDAAINATSLKAVVAAAPSQRKPAYLALGESTLVMNGVAGKIAAGVETSLTVNVGNKVRFDRVTIDRDPVKRTIALTSTTANPGSAFLQLPIAGAAITQVLFNGLIDEQAAANSKYALDGKYVVGGSSPRDFSATLSGGAPAEYVVTVHADTTLGQLLGWSAPGLDALAVREVSFGNGYSQGRVSIKGLDFNVVVFKGAGQARSSAAFLSADTLRLPKLASALQSTPLADLELSHPGFVLVHADSAGNAVSLPAAVAPRFGVPTLSLKAGLNLFASGNTYNDLELLLRQLGLPTRNLPLTGVLDPSILSGVDTAGLSQAFLNALDLRVPFDRLTLPGLSSDVTASDGYLALKGLAKGIDAAVSAKITVHPGKASPLVFATSLRLLKAASGTTVDLAGSYPGDWQKPFGIDWLSIRNVKISGTIGQLSTLSVGGTTDIGKTRNVTVLLDLAKKAEGGTEVALQALGADLSLADIPVLSSLPAIGDLKLRNPLIAPDAIGGILQSAKFPLLHNLEAVAFNLGGHWHLASVLGDFDLSKANMLPGFAMPVLGKLKFGKSAFMFSGAGFNARLAELPHAAQLRLLDIHGAGDGLLRVPAGISLGGRINPASLGSGLARLLPTGQPLVVQGSIGGLFDTHAKSLSLSATIPPIALPSHLAFIHLPANVRTAFFVKLADKDASLGVGIEEVVGVKLGQQVVNFDAVIAFGVDNQGGVSADLQGTLLNPWRNVLGIKGFALDPGSRIELKPAATGELKVGFVGKTHIGSRIADVAGAAGVIGGTVDKGAFELKLNELLMSDLLTLFNASVTATGGQPIKVDFPEARLTNVDMAFASPGVSMPEIGLPDGGTRLAGDLWFLLKDKPLTKAKAQITDSGMSMSGTLADFTLGPVSMAGNRLDVRAPSNPATPPYFKILGRATVMGKHADGAIESGLEKTEITTALDLGGLLNLDVRASFDTPVAGLTAGNLASQDMALNAHLKSDLGAWLHSDGKKYISSVFDSVGGDIKKLVKDLETAQKAVDTLNGQIARARERAKAGAKTVDQQIVQAQKKVNDLASRVNSLKHDISNEKSKIHKCNYSRSICYWWNWRGHCTKHKNVPDVVRDAACEVDNTHHVANIAAYEAALKTAEAARLAADKVLEGLKKGERGIDIASLDPEVIALEASLVTADLALKTAKALSEGAELAVQQLATGLKALDRTDAFELAGSSVSGSFQRAVAGKPVLLGLDFKTAGKPQHVRLTLSLKDPAYNARQLETLALLVAKELVEEIPGVAPVVGHLLNDAFKKRHDESEKAVEQAVKDNGLGD